MKSPTNPDDFARERLDKAMTVSSGGEAIVSGLVAHGVDTVFGLPGAQIYGLFDAFQQAQLKVIGARHEQACGYMAYGYARSTGRPGVFSVVPGPGVLNAGAALLTAFGSNEPVLCLTGQVPTTFLGKGRGHLHEMPDQLATLRTFVKWAERIEYPDAAPALVSRAFQEMLSGRRGPVALEMPWDVFTQRAETGAAKPFDRLPAPLPDPERVKGSAALIANSKAPMIFVGSGAIHAHEEILELAELIDAPVVAFRSGRGIVSNAHELGLTMAAAYRLWSKTDLMIGIGTRLELATMSRWPFRPDGLKSIRIDIDASEMRRFTPDSAIVADARTGTNELLAAVRKAGYKKTNGRRAAIREASAAAHEDIQRVQPQMAYLNILREVLPDNAIVTDELSQVGFASWYGFPVYEPRTFITSGYQGTLGSGFPTALGAKVANPDRPVVAITGDGGFMFGVQELATAVQFNIGVVTLVFNNNSYGNVRRDQRERFDGRVVASDLVNPDFVKLAESFGVGAARVTSPQVFRPALEKALAHGGPYLIDVEVPKDSETTPWTFIHPAKP
jgi:acetolactate synthase I/II/III large subunit